jgi:hypothetical protein
MDELIIAGKSFDSRLIVGTGKYSSPAVMVKAHEASGAEMITVAVRRVNISDRTKESLLDYIDTARYFLLPNTAGCYTADEAIRTARLGREAGRCRTQPRRPEARVVRFDEHSRRRSGGDRQLRRRRVIARTTLQRQSRRRAPAAMPSRG